ncbi:neutral amino acid transport system substrate-binding protein [Microbacterium sp. SORGH_AS428]|uniref:ABC transporter substrate-binding protein n=1 Tax=Microbacterium sp. SORGH_AS_0428 TaxID=3041788 RepID=UPI0028568288|nr:ABC transporter substrate-binding protein [Microbacterium sp. SORGH_AS_0428]MDR6199229.1 neutral amino acid transport system substrate-binding protein [Microbacterium sp. SORGH_AS_0428]
MVHSKKAWFAATALAGVSALALVGCAGGGEAAPSGSSDAGGDYTAQNCADGTTSADILKVGTLLPTTGTLAFLGPPEIAGVGLAVDDIVAAGDKACTFWTDSGDSNDMTVSSASADELINAKVSIVIGAASSSVSLNVVDKLTKSASPIVQISPANTAATLSGYSPFYFRTAPPDTVQGSALGQLITSDGNANIAFLVFNDAYGTGLRDVIEETVTGAGGSVTYGAKGAGQEFPPGQTTFSSEVTAALATNPDAIVIIAFDETKAIIPELVSQGWDMSRTYYTDGNTSDFSKDFEAGTLEGAQGTIPGANPADDFKKKASAWHEAVEGSALDDYSYSAESYDAVILSALAALKGGATDPATIQANLAAVSGATGGEECSTYADCKELIAGGKDIHYTGVAGTGPFNDKNDPSSAFIGIYKFDGDNKPVWQSAVEGKS